MPAPRRLASRTDAQVLELAASFKRENPTRTVAQVAGFCAPPPGGRPRSRPCCAISTGWI